jgi:thymidylate kinase
MNMTDHKAKPKRLIIFEGPDCAGKTTLMREFKNSMLDTTEVHHGPYPRLSAAHLPRYYVDGMMPLLHQYENMLMDRSWLSEAIYGAVFRGGVNRIGTEARRHLERIAMRHGAVVVLCLPPWEKVKEQWLKRKNADSEAEYLDKIEQLEQVYKGYAELRTELPVVRYDYTLHGNQLTQLKDEVARAAMRLHKTVGTVGNLDAKVILVGDKPSDHTDQDVMMQWPFCSFSTKGSSRWLTSLLDDHGIRESDLLWVNASSGLYQIKDLYARTVIALGQTASQSLQGPQIPHLVVKHPQAHKRFHSSEPYELMDLITASLK